MIKARIPVAVLVAHQVIRRALRFRRQPLGVGLRLIMERAKAQCLREHIGVVPLGLPTAGHERADACKLAS
jgi:hypothetical protein